MFDLEISEDVRDFLLHNSDRVWAVGGAVRDIILSRRPMDYDFLITGVVEEELDELLPHAERAGEHFPVYIWQGVEFTWTSYDSPRPDLSRRDFTINSLAVKPAGGRIYDPQGGFYDLKNKLLQPLPGSFSRDAHRFYRALRLISQLPDFNLTGYCHKKIADMEESDLLNISPERVAEEFKYVLTAEAGERFFFVQEKLDISPPHFRWLGPDLKSSLQRWQAMRQLSDSPKLLFAALALDSARKDELLRVHDILPLPQKWYRAADLAADVVEKFRNWPRIPSKELAEAFDRLKPGILNLQEAALLARTCSRCRLDFSRVDCEKNYYSRLLAFHRAMNDAVRGQDLLEDIAEGPDLGRELLQRQIRWLKRNRSEYDFDE